MPGMPDFIDPSRPLADPSRAFLLAGDVPPDLLRLRPGDAVEPVRLRRVVRVGYRLRADECYGEAEALLSSPRGREVRSAFASLTGGTAFSAEAERDLAWAAARALVRARGFGAADRGAWAEDVLGPGDARRLLSSAVRWDGVCPSVVSSRRVVLGRRYPPCGSGEDREDGGLERPRHAVLVSVSSGWECFSGDLRRALYVGRCRCGRGVTEAESGMAQCGGCGDWRETA